MTCSPLEVAAQFIVIMGFFWTLFAGAVPMTLGMVDWGFGRYRKRKP